MLVPQMVFLSSVARCGYHFHPDEACILRKMAGSGTGIVLEPMQNLSQSTNPMIRLLARSMSFISGTLALR